MGPPAGPPGGQYPGGSYFPPQSNQPYPPPPGHHQPNKRSATPMVIGILMLVFGGLGLLFTLIGLANSGDSAGMGFDSDFDDKLSTYQTWQTISYLVGLVIGVVHIVAGVQCVRYKRTAPKWSMIYGWLAIAWQVISVILIYAWLSPMLSDVPGLRAFMGIFVVFGAIIGMAWPIIVLALMSRPGAKQACAQTL